MPQLKEIMTPSVEVVSPNATAADAARKMLYLDVGAVPVCDGDRLLGMITDRDLVLRVMAISRDPAQARVSEAMTAGLVFCFEDEEAEVAAELMVQKQIRRLPVLSRTKQLVGIVSLGDLAVDGLDPQMSGTVLHEVSDSSRSHRESRREETMARYSGGTQKTVKQAMHKRKKGTLKSGSGRRVKNRKQTIAIGLSEARKKGKKVPAKKS